MARKSIRRLARVWRRLYLVGMAREQERRLPELCKLALVPDALSSGDRRPRADADALDGSIGELTANCAAFATIPATADASERTLFTRALRNVSAKWIEQRGYALP